MGRRKAVRTVSSAIIGAAWRVILFMLVIYFLQIGALMAYRYGHGLLYQHAMEEPPGTEASIEILKGESRRAIAEKLEKAGLIDNQDAFLFQSRLYKAEFVPGSYTLNRSMSIKELIDYLKEEGRKLTELRERKLLTNDAESEGASQDSRDSQEAVGDEADVTIGDSPVEGESSRGAG